MSRPRSTWTDARVAYLRHLRDDLKLTWAKAAAAVGSSGKKASQAYYSYRGIKIDPAIVQAGKVAAPDHVPHYAAGPPIKGRGRVPKRTSPAFATSPPLAPPPSPRARRYCDPLADFVRGRIAEQGLTAGLFGDPPAGRSALDQKRGIVR